MPPAEHTVRSSPRQDDVVCGVEPPPLAMPRQKQLGHAARFEVPDTGAAQASKSFPAARPALWRQRQIQSQEREGLLDGRPARPRANAGFGLGEVSYDVLRTSGLPLLFLLKTDAPIASLRRFSRCALGSLPFEAVCARKETREFCARVFGQLAMRHVLSESALHAKCPGSMIPQKVAADSPALRQGSVRLVSASGEGNVFLGCKSGEREDAWKTVSAGSDEGALMDKPLFSVIIPCFRDHEFARGAVRSCLDQLDVVSLEVVVVDDGSDEQDYLAFAEGLLGETRVKVLWQPNVGLAAARNRGVKESTGQYLLFLDADDLIGSRYLCTVQGVIYMVRADPRCVILSPFSYFAHPGEKASSLMAHFRAPRLMSWPFFNRFCILTGNCFPVSSCVISRVVYNEAGGFDERLTHHEDWELWIRIVKAGARVRYTDGGYAAATHVRMRRGLMSNTKAMRSSQREVIARHATGVASVLSFRAGWTILRLFRWMLILVQLALGCPDQHTRPGRPRQ